MIFAINSRMTVFIFANNVMKERRCLQVKPIMFARSYRYAPGADEHLPQTPALAVFEDQRRVCPCRFQHFCGGTVSALEGGAPCTARCPFRLLSASTDDLAPPIWSFPPFPAGEIAPFHIRDSRCCIPHTSCAALLASSCPALGGEAHHLQATTSGHPAGLFFPNHPRCRGAGHAIPVEGCPDQSPQVPRAPAC